MSVVSDMMSPIRSRRLSAVPPPRGQSSAAIPIALRVRNFRRLTTRMRVSIGVAALVVLATVVLLVVSTVPSGVRLSASTALIVGFCLLHVIVGTAIHLLAHRHAGSRKTSPDNDQLGIQLGGNLGSAVDRTQ
jgi:protein-S-isoprenylcysteine O-methyltransferase Ste14